MAAPELTQRFTLTLSSEARRELTLRAHSEGLTSAAWVRRLVMHELARVRNSDQRAVRVEA